MYDFKKEETNSTIYVADILNLGTDVRLQEKRD